MVSCLSEIETSPRMKMILILFQMPRMPKEPRKSTRARWPRIHHHPREMEQRRDAKIASDGTYFLESDINTIFWDNDGIRG
ncbi:unnamed protein product, partial [Symbiodinium sp. KB8]